MPQNDKESMLWALCFQHIIMYNYYKKEYIICKFVHESIEMKKNYIYDLNRGLVIDCAPSTNIVVPVIYLEPSLIK